MAALGFTVNSGEVSLVAATAKTVLQIKAPANQAVRVKAINLFGKQPAGGTDTPVKFRLTRSTGSFGTGSSATPAKADPGRGETIQSTAYSNFTAEPTSPADAGKWFELQPQSAILYPVPFGVDLIIPGGQSLNIEATSGSTPTVMVSVDAEE